MEQLDIEKAKQILGDLKCKKELSCVRGEFENLCRVTNIGQKSHLACLEKDRGCTFSLPYGAGFICKCPIRSIIKTELGK